jgi:hypothetical protein
MKIAISIPEADRYDQAIQYQLRCATSLYSEKKEITVYLICKKSEFQKFSAYFEKSNCIILPIKPQNKKGLQSWYYRHVKLPAWLRKSGISAYLSDDHRTLKQSLLKQIVFLNKAEESEKQQLLPHLQRASTIITPTTYLQDILKKWDENLSLKSITVMPGSDANYSPSYSDIEIEKIIEMTEGKEYFFGLFSDGEPEHIISVLKAFSIFKKFQRSGIKLVMSVSSAMHQQLVNVLKSYKYRDEVILLNLQNKNETGILLSKAYANIIIKSNYVLYESMMESLRCGVPLLMQDHPNYRSAFGNHVIYFNLNEQEIAQKIMLIYKDDTLKKELSQNSRNFSINSDWALALRPLINLLTS